MAKEFKELTFKHRRNDILGAIYGHLTEDACFIAIDEIERNRDRIFNELTAMHQENKSMTVTEKIEYIANRSVSIQEYTFLIYCLGQEATAHQIGSGIIKIITDRLPPDEED